MKKISLLFLCFIIIISKCYASDCCNIPYSEAEFHKGICVFISTIQNIFRRDCYLNKLNECLEIVRNNIEKIDEDLIYGIYVLLMINNELFNANSKEETKNVFEKYLTVSKMYKTDAEEKVNDISNLKFCDDNHRFIHYKYTQILIKVLFGLLNKILEIGKKKKRKFLF